MSDAVLWLPAMLVGLVPLGAVAWYSSPIKTPSAWWWLAGAFAVSFVADVATLAVPHPLISAAYPLLQAGLFAAILAPRPIAIAVIAGLLCVSGLSLAWRGAVGLDLWFHLAAWWSTSVLAFVNLRPGTLRDTLMLGFTTLGLAWVVFTLAPTFPAWGLVQGVRLLTAVGFVFAVREAARDAP